MKNFLKKIGQQIVRFFINIYCKIVYRLKIEGIEKIPNEGPLIFCGNHKSYLDPVIIVCYATRDMRFMAKEELKKNPIIRFMAFLFNAIYVKRDSKDISSIKEAIKTLKSGECIGIFPEGTRNGFEKNNGEIKGGAAHLALKTNAKIVPIGIIGEEKPFTKNLLIFGDPLDFSEYITGKMIEKETEEKVSQIIKEKILELVNRTNEQELT